MWVWIYRTNLFLWVEITLLCHSVKRARNDAATKGGVRYSWFTALHSVVLVVMLLLLFYFLSIHVTLVTVIVWPGPHASGGTFLIRRIRSINSVDCVFRLFVDCIWLSHDLISNNSQVWERERQTLWNSNFCKI